MTENKQIEEMHRELENWDDTQTDLTLAEWMYSKGYRKASEVAREIFSELEATFYGDGFHYFIATAVFDSLKKKYTEGGQ